MFEKRTTKEKILAILFVFFLFVMVGCLLWYISYNNKIENTKLRETVLAKKIPPFVFENLNWLASTSTLKWSRRDSHTAFVFKDKMWVLGGLDATLSTNEIEPNYDQAKYYNDIWYTEDGFNWTRGVEKANFPLIRSASVFTISDKLFMVGGYSPDPGVLYNNGLWTSTDGLNWKKEETILPWSKREGQKIVKFQDKYLMVGGVNYQTRERFNDVWESVDGYNWSLLTKSADWEPRWDMEISEFNNKLWLTGGMTSVAKIFGDEWVSEDGKHWDLVYSDAPFGKLQGHTSIVSNGNLMLVGGIDDLGSPTSETWITSNGLDWKKQTNQWVAREDHSAVLFKKRIWILGGMNYKFDWLDEIYYSNFQYFDGIKVSPDKVTLYPGKCPQSNNASSSEQLTTIFLNRENRLADGFVPNHLVTLDSVVKTEGEVCLNRLAGEELIKMFRQAENENVYLGVTFGYRAPEKQKEMYDFWVRQSGTEKAEEGIAKPYYSEHQLGLAVDLTGKSIDYLGVSMKFGQTVEADWLKNNAHFFGFVLSYPEEKNHITGYIYEPWHYRYIGVDLAKTLHNRGITFTEYQNSLK